MRVAIFSDLHLTHWMFHPRHIQDPLPSELVAESVAQERPDLLIDAGDTEMPRTLRYALAERGVGHIPLISVKGNHDYYTKWWHGNADQDFEVVKIAGKNIIATTLWSDFRGNNPLIAYAVRSNLADYTQIKGFTTDVCYETHCRQLELLTFAMHELPIDIVVTHHAPSFQSVHHRYRRGGTDEFVNYGFASDLDHIVQASGAKLWVHGHTHDPSDYMIGGTRVVAKPCGYPDERAEIYKPLYVEI